jgi:hypothetical protein
MSEELKYHYFNLPHSLQLSPRSIHLRRYIMATHGKCSRGRSSKQVQQQSFEGRIIRELLHKAGQNSLASEAFAGIPGDVAWTFALFNQVFPASSLRLYSASVEPSPLLELLEAGRSAQSPLIVSYRRHVPDRENGALVIHRPGVGPMALHNYSLYFPTSSRTTRLSCWQGGYALSLERWDAFLERLAENDLSRILGEPVGLERASAIGNVTPAASRTEDGPRPRDLSPFRLLYIRDDEWFHAYPELLCRTRTNVVAGLLASHLVYLFSYDALLHVRAGIRDHDGTRWWACTQGDAAGWVAASPKQIKLAIQLLKKENMLITRKIDGQERGPRQTQGFRGMHMRPGPELEEFMNSDVPERRQIVRIPRQLFTMLGPTASLVASQIAYWFRKGKNRATRARYIRCGEHWVYKTHKALAEETGLTECQARDAVQKLVDCGLLIRCYWKVGRRRVSFFRFDEEELVRQWETAAVASFPTSPEPPSVSPPTKREVLATRKACNRGKGGPASRPREPS